MTTTRYCTMLLPKVLSFLEIGLTVNQLQNLQVDWAALVTNVLVVQVVEVTRQTLVEDVSFT